MPLFSVIIPSFNRADLIRATLDSVLASDFDDYEIVVADDGSKDGTPTIVDEYVAKYPEKVKQFIQQNRGEGAARNLAIRNATGEYLAYLDSDDTFFPWTLSSFRRAVDENERPAAVGGMCFPFRDEALLAHVKPEPYAAQRYPDVLSLMRNGPDMLTTSGSIMRRDVVERAGLFQELHINSVDLDLWLRVGEESGFVRLRSPYVAGRRAHVSNISGNKEMMIKGAKNLINREKTGVYPGGKARQRERLEFMLFNVRFMMLDCVRAGRQRAGWNIYRETFAWHIGQRRMRCLVGFPLVSLAQVFKPRR